MRRDLYYLRIKAGLTQQHLADLAGVSKSAIHKIENGLVDPQVGTLISIAQALGMPELDFIALVINEEDFSVNKEKK